jgi:hypothetical protein
VVSSFLLLQRFDGQVANQSIVVDAMERPTVNVKCEDLMNNRTTTT